jgi:hypothetical protein
LRFLGEIFKNLGEIPGNLGNYFKNLGGKFRNLGKIIRKMRKFFWFMVMNSGAARRCYFGEAEIFFELDVGRRIFVNIIKTDS